MKALAEIVAASDCAAILKRGQPLAERREKALPAEVAVALYELLARCDLEADRTDAAYSLLMRGTALAESTPKLWYGRLYVEMKRKRYGDVAATLEAMTQGHGATLNEMPIPAMWEVLREMKDAGAAAARTRVLKLLASDAYAPTETFGSNDGFRFLYAEDRLAAGDAAAAGPVVASFEDPYTSPLPAWTRGCAATFGARTWRPPRRRCSPGIRSGWPANRTGCAR